MNYLSAIYNYVFQPIEYASRDGIESQTSPEECVGTMSLEFEAIDSQFTQQLYDEFCAKCESNQKFAISQFLESLSEAEITTLAEFCSINDINTSASSRQDKFITIVCHDPRIKPQDYPSVHPRKYLDHFYGMPIEIRKYIVSVLPIDVIFDWTFAKMSPEMTAIWLHAVDYAEIFTPQQVHKLLSRDGHLDDKIALYRFAGSQYYA